MVIVTYYVLGTVHGAVDISVAKYTLFLISWNYHSLGETIKKIT